MGQQGRDPKRNPIAGMLQKELGITPQQGRKILEQRQKIRDVSSNLKEVNARGLYVFYLFYKCTSLAHLSSYSLHIVPRSPRYSEVFVRTKNTDIS
jgi:hypothetical protein